jgi:hypothetical protein
MSIHAKLAEIQAKLKAPKGQYNNFGKYAYRNCEDILSAVKPLTTAAGLVLTISDEIVMVGSRVYVKATAALSDGEHSVITTAYAREEDSKKGMDASQLTGSTSSYARKYALNGLFCIDDTKDADSQDNSGHETKAETITDAQIADMEALIEDVGADPVKFMRWLKVNDLAELTADRYQGAIAALEKKRAA